MKSSISREREIKKVKLAAWCVTLLLVYVVLLKVLIAFTTDLWESFAAGLAAPRAVTGEGDLGQAWKLAEEIEKVHAIAGAAAADLNSWRALHAAMSDWPQQTEGDELVSNIRGINEKIAELRESFSKSEIPNVRMGVLRDTQKRVLQMLNKVNKRSMEREWEHAEVSHAADKEDLATEECLSVDKATDLVKARIAIFSADRTGMVDYAMGPAGASVLPFTSRTLKQPSNSNGPRTAIDPVSRLGDCWAMQGSSGRLAVKLSQPVRVSSISIEHASRVLLLNGGRSAPKTFSVVGYRKGDKVGPDTVGDMLVSKADYKLDGDDIQFFDVSDEFREVEYGAVALRIEDNHGEVLFTCLYRFRVHGVPASTG